MEGLGKAGGAGTATGWVVEEALCSTGFGVDDDGKSGFCVEGSPNRD